MNFVLLFSYFFVLKVKDIIIDRIKKFDKSAFELLYQEYYERLCIYLMSYSSDKEKIEDSVQDIFIDLWNKRHTLSIQSSLNSYLYKAAYNQLMEKYRMEKRNDKMLSSYYHTAVMLAVETDPSIKSDKLTKLNQCIEALPEKCKEVFVQNKIVGLKYQLVAEKLGVSIKTVEGHITRAYSYLKDCLKRAV